MNGEQVIAPERRHSRRAPRRRRLVLVVVGVALAALVAGVGWLAFLNHQVGQVTRFDAGLGRADRPQRVASRTVNILLAGVDDGRGADLRDMLESGDWEPGVFRSDAIMVLHVAADRQDAQVVAIPRDSYVPVPGYGRTKINAAFSYGGPSLLVRTVEDLTGLYVDHVAVVDFDGFRGITEALGGIDVTVPRDGGPDSGRTLRLEGDEALRFVRERTSLARGDFDRIGRQQALLRAVLDASTSAGVLTNPWRLTALVSQSSAHVAVDATLTNGRLRDLLLSCRGLRQGDVDFLTVPVLGTATIDGASVVRLRQPELRSLFTAVAHDRFTSWRRSRA